MESRRWGPGRGRAGELVLTGHRVSVWEDENVLEMDGGDGCTNVRKYFMPLNCTLKMLKMVNFVYYTTFFNLKNCNKNRFTVTLY